MGSYPSSVAVRDVNGDGKADLVTANPGSEGGDPGSGTVSVLLGNGQGSFGAKTDFSVGIDPYSVAVADLNGDGKVDLVTANFSDSEGNTVDNTVAVLYNCTDFPLLLATSASPNPVCAGTSLALSATATGGSAPYRFSWAAPAGITLSATSTSAVSASVGAGVSGVQTFTLTAAASGGAPKSTSLVSVTVNAAPTASLVSSGSLSCGVTSVTLTASGGGTYRFSSGATQLNGGNTATVSTAGVYSVTVTAGATGCSAVASTLVSNGLPITVTNPATTSLVTGQGVTQAFTASGGQGPYSFSVASGSLPPGLSLATTGVLSGSPTQAGSFTAVVQATDGKGCTGQGLPFVVRVTGGTPSDLTLLLFAQPTLVYGPTSISVVVSVYELNGVATSGPVSVKLSEDTMLSLGVDPAATSMGGKPVQNALWRFTGPVDGMYTLTSTQPLPAGGRLSVGLSGPLMPGATKGKLSVSATVVDERGTETRLNNNQDAETIEYFKK